MFNVQVTLTVFSGCDFCLLEKPSAGRTWCDAAKKHQCMMEGCVKGNHPVCLRRLPTYWSGPAGADSQLDPPWQPTALRPEHVTQRDLNSAWQGHLHEVHTLSLPEEETV